MATKIGLMSFAHMHGFRYAQCVNMVSEGVLIGAADDNPSRAKELSDKLGTTFYPTYKALLEQDIDAVIITAENSKHKELTIMAAEAGKHILCEKPIATTTSDAREMIDVCRKCNVKLMTAFPCRYSPAIMRMRETVRKGDIGKVLAICSTNHGKMPGGWFIEPEKSGGGAVIDHTVHLLDIMRWTMDAEPVEVYAEINNLMHHGSYDDVGMLTVEFDNGVFVTIDSSWSHPQSFPIWGDVMLRVTGMDGIATADMYAQTLAHYSDKDMKVNWLLWGSDTDYGLVNDFIKCVENDLPVSISGEDGLKAMEVALAAYKSYEIGAPIKLPMDDSR